MHHSNITPSDPTSASSRPPPSQEAPLLRSHHSTPQLAPPRPTHPGFPFLIGSLHHRIPPAALVAIDAATRASAACKELGTCSGLATLEVASSSRRTDQHHEPSLHFSGKTAGLYPHHRLLRLDLCWPTIHQEASYARDVNRAG
jgi:hypothetical protein